MVSRTTTKSDRGAECAENGDAPGGKRGVGKGGYRREESIRSRKNISKILNIVGVLP